MNKKSMKVIICIMVCFISILPVVAHEADMETLTAKVGFFAFDGYHMQDENGVRSGYGFEILQHLAGYAGFRYEYVGYDKSWSEMQDMLANNEIDILTSAQKTPEREELFDFSDNSVGVSAAILTVKAGNNTFSESDYTHWNGIRVGMIEGNSRNNSFAQFAQEHGFDYVPVYFDSTDEMVAQLQLGSSDKEIDSILTSNLRKTTNEWVIAQFDSSPFYVMVKKGNTQLMDRINKAITQLDLTESGLRTELMNKYYASDTNDLIAFTTEERSFIESMKGKTLTAVINPDRAPYSFIKDGSFSGILYDIATKIMARTGLEVDFIDVSNRKDYYEVLKDADIRFDAEYNLAQEDFWLTPPFIEIPLGRLFLKETTKFETGAVPNNLEMVQTYNKKMEDDGLLITYFDSVADIIEAVQKGEQDEAILAIDSATMAERDDVRNKLIVEEVYGDDISYCVAVNRNQSRILYSIIAKATASLNQGEINTIRQTYSENLGKSFSIIAYVYDNPITVAVFVAVALSIATLIIILFMQVKRRKEATVHAMKELEQNKLLRDALASAEKAGAAKSQFLSRVSHELRTPLNAIIGFIELAKGTDKEQMEDYLTSSDIAAKQLLSVINDVLDMSSIESGKLKISSEPFNFRHMISSITNMYGTQCKQKGIEFQTKITTPTEDWIIGDELRINQILMNLLGNAVKFTSKGHIWLTISETQIGEDKVFFRFAVSDTGSGMSDEMKERLFKPFEQENAESARKYGGNGLGLSIVKNLVSMMDGTIKVESIQGEGSTFTVDLPFMRSNLKNQLSLPSKANSLHILAVDDEKAERDYISTVLKRMGVRFTCVESGFEALKELEQSEKYCDIYNVCLIDWQMPQMNGLDTTEMIRKKYGKDLIVIVVSAYDFQQAGDSAKKAGANLFISKPIFQSSLFDLLMTLTGGEIAKLKDKPKNWDFAGRRVLLAEDNTLNQIVTMACLAKFNVVVELAENGKIAVDKFLSSEPGYYNAILMDVQMPVMDGLEATRTIRASNHPEAARIPIIAQTADAFNEDIAKTLSAGMNAHVSKPLKPDLLAKTLFFAFQQEE